MTPGNHTGVTSVQHADKALRHLEAAQAARHTLTEAYSADWQDRAAIADLHQQIGFGLKVAHIHAILATVPSDRSSRPSTGASFTTDSLVGKVHDHGPDQGRGVGCPERLVAGHLRGACLTEGGQ